MVAIGEGRHSGKDAAKLASSADRPGQWHYIECTIQAPPVGFEPTHPAPEGIRADRSCQRERTTVPVDGRAWYAAACPAASAAVAARSAPAPVSARVAGSPRAALGCLDCYLTRDTRGGWDRVHFAGLWV